MKIKPINGINFRQVISKATDPNSRKPIEDGTKLIVTGAVCSGIYNSPTVNHRPKKVTNKEIKQKLFELGYVEDSEGTLRKKLKEREIASLRAEHKPFSYEFEADYYATDQVIEHDTVFNKFKNLYETPIKKKDLRYFEEFLNIDKAAGRKMFDTNFEKIFMIFLILNSNDSVRDVTNLCRDNKNLFKIIENIFKSNIDDKTLYTILDFKTSGFNSINKTLRKKAINPYYDEEKFVREKIDLISTYINTQPLPEGIKLYRVEGFGVLDNIKMSDGSVINLGQRMKSAARNRDREEIQKIREFVLENEVIAVQPGFMSTTTDTNSLERHIASVEIEEDGGGLFWQFEPKSGTKGVFIEGINVDKNYSDEKEFLINKDTKIRILDVNYDEAEDTWELLAKISN